MYFPCKFFKTTDHNLTVNDQHVEFVNSIKYLGVKIRGGQYRGTVTQYFFSTVIDNVGTFSKKYRFWYRRYFFSTFTAVLGTFAWNGIKDIQKELILRRNTFKPCPRNKPISTSPVFTRQNNFENKLARRNVH